MSFHRVLPPPKALADPSHSGSWIPRRDSLLQNSIMADSNPKTREDKTQDKSLNTAQPRAPAIDNRESSQPSDISAEGDDPPPRTRARSSATLSNESSNPSDQPVPSARASITEQNTEWNTPSSFCLCQPEPKVPRPRNAFILYRQHHQAHVVARNPGLANPEISKVIGDQWRNSPPELKVHWKNLAEEEKIRHQRQYPDYRYQPRRNGRNNSLSSSTTTPVDSENRRCAKCGGRSMNTPAALSSAGYQASASSNSPGTPYSANRPPSTPSTASSAKRFLQGAGSPPPPTSGKTFLNRNRDLSSNISALGLATPRMKRPEDAEYPLSPDVKRRRIAGQPYGPGQRAANGPSTPFAFPRRRESLPRPDFMNSPTFTMGPPPRPHPIAHPPDSSLTLPPLRHSLPSGDVSQAKSVEAMVMSIPTLNKIRILSKISPPLAKTNSTSPGPESRGFIIAVDGQESAAVEQITAYLNTVCTPSYAVKVFQSPLLAEESQDDGTEDDKAAMTTLEECHLTMAKYLALSVQLKAYITSSPSTSGGRALSSPAVSPKSVPLAKPRTETPSMAAADASKPTFATETLTSSAKETPDALVPVALVPAYQLTNTDRSACRVPIDDSYAPTDHWQWMASMWRGIVGPDITIAVRGNDDGSLDSRGRVVKGGAEVEVRLEDSRAVIVRVEKGGKVAEGGLRRLGFEVGEWIRGRGGS
ncbi:MAG: hypothetical protein Q9174_001288 [Haloplaca sp. 1 TL-2023]